MKIIIVTGASCSGKSSIINEIKNKQNIIIVKESATDLFNCSFKNPEKIESKAIQKLLFAIQIIREQNAFEYSKNNNIKLVVCDRGLLDNSVFCKPKEFEDICNFFSVEITDYLKNYSNVFHFETIAKSNPKLFKKLKPDFFEENNFNILMSIIKNEGLLHTKMFMIPDYYLFCSYYRENDIQTSGFSINKTEEEITRTNYATFTYKKIFTGNKNKGVAIIFENCDEKTFDKLSKIKKNMRNYINKNMQYTYYVDISKPEWIVYKHFNNDTNDKEYINLDSVKLVFINGIHMEEKEMFEKQICYNALKKCACISKENEINLENLKILCKGEKQNDKENTF